MNSVFEKLAEGHEFVQVYLGVTTVVAVALLITVSWKVFWRKSVYPLLDAPTIGSVSTNFSQRFQLVSPSVWHEIHGPSTCPDGLCSGILASYPAKLQLRPDRFLRFKTLQDDIILVDKSHLKEYFDAPESQISFTQNVAYQLQMKYTFSPSVERNHYHAVVTRIHLTRHIPELMPVIVDELFAAFYDSEFEKVGGGNVPHGIVNTEWTPICAYEKSARIVARISNRVFVGLPLCNIHR